MRKRLMTAELLVLFIAVPVRAQEIGEEAASQIRGVIESQLRAFQRDDGGEAFSYASPFIKQKFRTPDIFMQMVKTGYPSVYRPKAYEFRELLNEGGKAVQQVLFVAPDGSLKLARYYMMQEADGAWKINGVHVTEAPEAAA